MRTWQRRNIIIIGIPVVAMLTVGLPLGITAVQRPSRPATVADTVTIDPNIGETFAPAPQDAAPKLTAEQAFAQQRRRNGDATAAVSSRSLLASPSSWAC